MMKLYGANPSPLFRKVTCGNLSFAGLAIDAGRWPHPARYYGALCARASFETVMAA
jgi:hypothetical protein